MQEIKCPNCGKAFTIDEGSYAEIVRQIRNSEFDAELKARTKTEVALSETTLKEQIGKLQAELNAAKNNKELEIKNAVSESEKKAAEEIANLKTKLEKKDLEKEKELTEQKSHYETELNFQKAEYEKLKEHKLQLSNKNVGEDLEQYCSNEFEKVHSMAFKNAKFSKDNDAGKDETKGDFIFRDFSDGGIEYVSIMFEMKNEREDSVTKQQNSKFFEKLDKDRKKKDCEYAVLVSMLEPESELYNTGIVEVCDYEKMYVIRPQFFIQLISILRNAAKNNLADKVALAEYKNKNADLENLESQINDFKDKFGKNFRLASEHFATAVKRIDDTIAGLTKTKEELLASIKQLSNANNKAEDLSLKQLVKNSPMLEEEYKALKKGKK